MWAVRCISHMSRHSASHPVVWPPEGITGHGVKYWTADCDSPRGAGMKLAMPKYSQGRDITFSMPRSPLKVTTWPKVISRVNRWNQRTEDLDHEGLVFRALTMLQLYLNTASWYLLPFIRGNNKCTKNARHLRCSAKQAICVTSQTKL